jgi:hypothetical protein
MRGSEGDGREIGKSGVLLVFWTVCSMALLYVDYWEIQRGRRVLDWDREIWRYRKNEIAMWYYSKMFHLLLLFSVINFFHVEKKEIIGPLVFWPYITTRIKTTVCHHYRSTYGTWKFQTEEKTMLWISYICKSCEQITFRLLEFSFGAMDGQGSLNSLHQIILNYIVFVFLCKGQRCFLFQIRFVLAR